MPAHGNRPAPAPTLGRVLDRLGATLLTFEAGPQDLDRPVQGVLLDDPIDPPVIPAGSIVLAVGVADPADLVAKLAQFSEAGAAAVVVRDPVPTTPEVVAAAERSRIPVFGLIRGASWMQIATLLSATLGPTGDLAPDATDSGADLFELAESIAALLEAPITIEDLSSRVLAYSADQAGTDEPRRLTILGRQVPARYSVAQRRAGTYRRIYSSDRPVYIERAEPEGLPRAVMRVRAGDEVLGSIWAVVRERLSPQREQTMVEAARVVAMTILRARLSADSAQRLRLSLVTMLLEGGATARDAALQLGLEARPACVLAFGARGGTVDDVQLEAEAQRATSALTMYLKAIYPRAVAALLGGIIYAVLPLRGSGPADVAEAERVASRFIDRLTTPIELFAGIGGIVSEISDLPSSRSDADAALRVLRTRARPGSRVATLDAVRVDSLMLRIADELAADHVPLGGQLARLAAYDREHATALVPTLRAWLESFGDVAAAAAAVHVHKNTFRYRLARLAEVGGIDLGDPDERFGLLLQLRLLSR